MTWSIGLLGRLLGAGVLLGVGCTPDDLGMTATAVESSSSGGECPVGSLNCRCTAGNSCDVGLVCAQTYCVEPDPGSTSSGEATTTEDPTTQGEESTGGATC